MNLTATAVLAVLFSLGFLPVQAARSSAALRIAIALGAALSVIGVARLLLGPSGLAQMADLAIFGSLALLGFSIVIGWLSRRALLARFDDARRRRQATLVSWLVLAPLFGFATQLLWAAA